MNVWIDGRITPAARATVSALDPAMHIGSGLFEVMRAYDGVPFLLDRHLARMRRSARKFKLRVPHGDVTLKRGVIALLRANKLRSAYVRLTLTGGGAFMIRAEPLPRLPAAWYRKGAAVDFAPWRRDPRAPLYGHKTLNYLENVLTLERAREKGLADYLFLSTDGSVLEGCVTNVFLVSRGRLVTPALEGILPGVTRDEVIRIAKSLKIPVAERRVLPRDLEQADEVLLTNALIEVLPISRVGTRRIGLPGPVTQSLMAGYRASR
jgi:branched-subunit amino acid aminotransferase/4-amino-4-deoxychorismate lyase